MKKLSLILKVKPEYQITPPFLAIEGSHSLMATDPQDFATKLRLFLDDLHHIKYLDHLELLLPEDLTSAEKEKSMAYGHIAEAVVRDMKASLGGFDDSYLGLTNFFENLGYIIEKPDISHIKITKPFHACVVAAGPSLALELDEIKRIQNSALIVCVDACFKTLLNHGIEPHIVVAMERDDFSPKFFLNIQQNYKTALICHATVKRYLIDAFKGPIATALKYSGPFMWLPFERAKGWTASSSAHLAYRLCALLGAQSIALIGQDLCFHPDTYQSHCEIPDYPEWSVGTSKENRLAQNKAITAPGNTRAEVLTDKVWSLFARDYHILFRELNVPTVNTSKLGMKLKDIPFQELSVWSKQVSSASINLEIPQQNQSHDQDLKALNEKLRFSRNYLEQLLKKLKNNASDELYRDLLFHRDFLELVFELVFADWVKTENAILNLTDEKSIDLKKQFLHKAEKAIEAVLKIMPIKVSPAKP